MKSTINRNILLASGVFGPSAEEQSFRFDFIHMSPYIRRTSCKSIKPYNGKGRYINMCSVRVNLNMFVNPYTLLTLMWAGSLGRVRPKTLIVGDVSAALG